MEGYTYTVGELTQTVKNANPKTKVIFYMTMALRRGDPGNKYVPPLAACVFSAALFGETPVSSCVPDGINPTTAKLYTNGCCQERP